MQVQLGATAGRRMNAVSFGRARLGHAQVMVSVASFLTLAARVQRMNAPSTPWIDRRQVVSGSMCMDVAWLASGSRVTNPLLP